MAVPCINTLVGCVRRVEVPASAADKLNHLLGHGIATMAAERKRIGERGAKLLVQGIAQQRASAMQPCLHGLGFKAEQIGGFLDSHGFDNARNEDGSE